MSEQEDVSGGDGDVSGRRKLELRKLLKQTRDSELHYVDLTRADTDVDGACDQYEELVGPLPDGFRETMWRISDTIGESQCTLNDVVVSTAMWQSARVDDLRDTVADLVEWASDFATATILLSRFEERPLADKLDRGRRDLEELRRRARTLQLQVSNRHPEEVV